MGKNSFTHYIELLARLDNFGRQLQQRLGAHIACAPGCADCCGQVLEIMPVEFYYLQSAARQKPPNAGSEAGSACPILYRGLCALYDHRPVICRTHGLPLLLEEEGRHWVDCCKKNFMSGSLPELPGDSLLHLERLNLLLVSINHVFSAAAGIDAAQRISIAELFKNEGAHG